MHDRLVTFNAGSSTVKIGSFVREGDELRRVTKGVIDFSRAPLRFHMDGEQGKVDLTLASAPDAELIAIFEEIFDKLSSHGNSGSVDDIAGFGHRIVHGGDDFHGSVLLDAEKIAAVDRLSSFAPLHQPKSVALVRAMAGLFPDIPQVASFDTAFHRTMPDVVRRFAIPRALHERGIKRYGFHGLSYQSIIGNLRGQAPEIADRKIIAAHLGSGASLCAMEQGQSVDTSMSFSTLDGIPMATRCGALDPGVMLHLLQQENMGADALSDLLYHKSGLLGLSDISGDTRDLLASDKPEARQALDVFTFRIAGEISRLATTLGGLDALVFTAGIGENQPAIRTAVCQRLAWLGLELDGQANDANSFYISSASSKISAFVLATDEEHIIATQTFDILNGKGNPA